MSQNKLKKGGWQTNIRYFKDCVIKTPKTAYEIRKLISKHFEYDHKLIERKIKELRDNWKNSMKIIKSGKIPMKLLAYPEFIKGGKIKQKRVKMLIDEFNRLMRDKDLKKARKLVDKAIDFILTLWGYGIHEMTFKFYHQFGLMRGDLVLVDLGEITDDKEIVRQELLKKEMKVESLRKHHHGEVFDYYIKQIRKRLTVDVLDKVWGSNLK